MDCDLLTKKLYGYTNLRYLEFSVDIYSGECRLVLDLEKTETNSEAIQVKFEGVGNLFIKDFGGGLTQIKLLSIKDLKYLQHDRVNYEVKDLEDESIFFKCRKITIANL